MSFTTASKRACANDSASTTTALPPRKLSHQNFVTTLPPTHSGDAIDVRGAPGKNAALALQIEEIRGQDLECMRHVAVPPLNSSDHGLFAAGLIIYGTDFRTSFASASGTRANSCSSSVEPRC